MWMDFWQLNLNLLIAAFDDAKISGPNTSQKTQSAKKPTPDTINLAWVWN